MNASSGPSPAPLARTSHDQKPGKVLLSLPQRPYLRYFANDSVILRPRTSPNSPSRLRAYIAIAGADIDRADLF
jgi:hypothetical protein